MGLPTLPPGPAWSPASQSPPQPLLGNRLFKAFLFSSSLSPAFLIASSFLHFHSRPWCQGRWSPPFSRPLGSPPLLLLILFLTPMHTCSVPDLCPRLVQGDRTRCPVCSCLAPTVMTPAPDPAEPLVVLNTAIFRGAFSPFWQTSMESQLRSARAAASSLRGWTRTQTGQTRRAWPMGPANGVARSGCREESSLSPLHFRHPDKWALGTGHGDEDDDTKRMKIPPTRFVSKKSHDSEINSCLNG